MLADDHQLFRDGLAALLTVDDDFEVVASVSDGDSAVAAYQEYLPEIALFDLRMPDFSGIEATRRIMVNCPEARVIILTTFDGEDEIYSALKAGASGFLLKDCSRDDLIEGITAVLNGDYALPLKLSSKAANYHNQVKLSDREREVLTAMADGLRNREIAARLGITEGTTKVHLHNVFRKIGARNRAEAIRNAKELGVVA